jgi:hypothetical protein
MTAMMVPAQTAMRLMQQATELMLVRPATALVPATWLVLVRPATALSLVLVRPAT